MKQSLPKFSPNHTGELSPEDSQPSLMAVMDLLVDISSMLATNEQFVDDLRAEKMEKEERRLQSKSLTWAPSSTCRYDATLGEG